MRTGSPFQKYQDLQKLITSLEEQYSFALTEANRQAMVEACGGLCITYSAIGNGELAHKWAEQYLFHLAETTGGPLFGCRDGLPDESLDEDDDNSKYC
jgi:hypothetical protein